MRDYFDVLAEIHALLKPRTYLEIGVDRGDSLRLARGASICVGVDPDPKVTPEDLPGCYLERTTSDEFFLSKRPRELFGGRPVDLVFIDGMHLFEYALRDFYNSEAIAASDSLIVFHDCLPADAESSSRERSTSHWTGDVWKLVLCLLDYRPGLQLSIVDVEYSGLCLVRGLSPNDQTLRTNYEALIDKYLPLTYENWQSRWGEVVLRAAGSFEARFWQSRLETLRLLDRLAEKEAALQSILTSKSWRLTVPIRRAGALLRHATDRPSGRGKGR